MHSNNLCRKQISVDALVIHKKETSSSLRKVFLISDKLPFLSVITFGAANSSKISALTSPFVRIQATIQNSKYGWQIIDCYELEFYENINNNLELFYEVSYWVKSLIRSSGFGEDNRLYSMFLPLFQSTHTIQDFKILNIIYKVRTLYLSGELPENIMNIKTNHFLQNPIVLDIFKEINISQFQKEIDLY